ncbi:MAG: hypothetical protein ACLFVU_11320 [Phycisphaerae bacterium]
MKFRISAVIVLLVATVMAAVGCNDTATEVNRENYEKIKLGMSLDRVQEILGPGEPVAVEHVPNQEMIPDGLPSMDDQEPKTPFSASWYQWQSSDVVLYIGFVNGEVVHKLIGNVNPSGQPDFDS